MEAARYDKLVNRHEITDSAVSAFADSAQIPERYIRTEEVLDGVVVGEDESYQLPVIDMSRLLDPELSALEIKKLGDACRNWGFFQVVSSSNYFLHLSLSLALLVHMFTRVFHRRCF
jgi:hypothetical protein